MQIVDLQYFGCVNYYFSLFNETNNIINIYDDWYKMSFLNRCVIVGANGLIELTVPIVGGRNQRAKVNQIKIDNTQAWQKQHFRAIVSSYAKAPYFDYYKFYIENLYNKKYEYLFEWNKDCNNLIEKILKLNILINYNINEISLVDSLDNRKKWLPKNYSIDQPVIKYNQLFEDKLGFYNNVSILDLAFNMGLQAKKLLTK